MEQPAPITHEITIETRRRTNTKRAAFIEAVSGFYLEEEDIIKYLENDSEKILGIGDPKILLGLVEHFDYAYQTEDLRTVLGADAEDKLRTLETFHEENPTTYEDSDDDIKLLDKVAETRMLALFLCIFIGKEKTVEYFRQKISFAFAKEFVFRNRYVPPQSVSSLTDVEYNIIANLLAAVEAIVNHTEASIKTSRGEELERIFGKFPDHRDLVNLLVDTESKILLNFFSPQAPALSS